MMPRRISKAIQIGGVTVGGGAPVVVQSMTKTDTRDVKATVRQIKQLAEVGCEIVRIAVPDAEAARALVDIKKQAKVPLVADIHFDYRLALASLEAGVDGLRLNPGNIGGPGKVKKVALAAKERSVPIRIGLNAGSLPSEALAQAGLPKTNTNIADRMVVSALEQIELLESLDFDLIKVSLKAFDVPTTIAAYRSIAEKMPYPLHIGITEAGTPRTGVIRSSVGIGTLLWLGLGDTIRVSLTASPMEEVFAAYEILKSLDLRRRGPVLVSCPTCGRAEADVVKLAQEVEKRLQKITKPIKVAVMGCVVNGPGEAKDADVGIACGKGKGVIFKKGKKLATIEEKDFLSALLKEIESITKN
ncbi:MAG: flavodoxin-dependent (E)-4-hydroxy-3-methylbut-2-enyl-diphosphate synthase [Dehalococcoidales bacterium]|nr:flavodoxin-dependent (E)-4-hydroxy-3-methylbut-2-enyl-diphosphate synthase [Dehalococcoidales bacterium]